MEATLARLYGGDWTVLPFVYEWLQSSRAAPTGATGREIYSFLAFQLCNAGPTFVAPSRDGPSLGGPTVEPPLHYRQMLEILATVAARQDRSGIDCRAVLLTLGLQYCRVMNLDAYFIQDNSTRYQVVCFVCILISIFGCAVDDLLFVPQNVQLAETSAVPTVNVPPGSITQRAGAIPLMVTNTQASTSAQRDGQQPGMPSFLANRAASPPPRGAVLTHILGTTDGLLPTAPGRRYRNLPLRPSVAPFPKNPMFDEKASPSESVLLPAQYPDPVLQFAQFHGLGCEPRVPGMAVFRRQQSAAVAKEASPAAVSLTSANQSTLPVDSARSAPIDGRVGGGNSGSSSITWSPPQPLDRLLAPTALAREAKLQALSESIRRGIGAGVADSGRDVNTLPVEVAIAPAALASISGKAPTDSAARVPTIPTSSDSNAERAAVGLSIPAGVVAECPFLIPFFPTQSEAAAELNKRALACPLLHEYLEEGRLVSWGERAYNALGPQKTTRNSRTAASARAATTAAAKVPDLTAESTASPTRTGSGADSDRVPPQQGRRGLLRARGAAAANRTSSPVPAVVSGRSVGDDDSMVDSPTAAAGQNSTGGAQEQVCYAPCTVRTPGKVVSVMCGTDTTYIVTETGVLCSCGRAESGQLGIGERGLRYAERGAARFQRVVLSREERVVAVFAGSATASAVSEDGYVFCWGHNAYGQCLRQPDSARVMLPIRFKTGKFKPAALGFGHGYAGIVFEDGVLGMWGHSDILGVRVPEEELTPTLMADGSRCVRRVYHFRSQFNGPVALLRTGPWHVLVVTRVGSVYTWGTGFEGRLGHGTDQDEVAPRLVEGLAPFFVVEASCGVTHSAVVTTAGDVYVFGDNKYGQLGLRGPQARRTPCQLRLPAPAIAVSCGRKGTHVLLQTGDVMACGALEVCGAGLGSGRLQGAPTYILSNYITFTIASGPTHAHAAVLRRTTALMRIGHSPIEELSRMESLVVRSGVRDVAVGIGFVVVLSENGTMAAVGRGECGQLGVGPGMRPTKPGEVTVVSSFEDVRTPPDVEFASVQCGPNYVLALDTSGHVFGWGSNEHGILTLPTAIPCVYEPVLLSAYEAHRIVQLACGDSFIAALTEDGDVLTHGEYPCCGLSTVIESPTLSANKRGVRVLKPSAIPVLKNVTMIAAGRHHAVAMTAACVVYTWGKGVLGTGLEAATIGYAPTKVALSQSIRKLGCGPYNSFAITDVGELFVWGGHEHGQCGLATEGEAAPQGGATDGKAGGATLAVPSPVVVARGVRDAAFTKKFGVVVLEKGGVRVSGSLRHGGRNHRLHGFSDPAQPAFSIDVNTVGRSSRGDAGATGADANPSGGSSDGRGLPAVSGSSARQLAAGETFFTPSRSCVVQGMRCGDGGPPAPGTGGEPQQRRLSMQSPRLDQHPGEDSRGSSSHRNAPAGVHAISAGLHNVRRERQCGASLPSLSPPPPSLPSQDAAPDDGTKTVRHSSTPTSPAVVALLQSMTRQEPAESAAARQSPVPPPPVPAAATAAAPTAGEPPVGLRCFGGYHQVFAVLEKNRPSPEEVQLTCRGLRVLLSDPRRGQ